MQKRRVIGLILVAIILLLVSGGYFLNIKRGKEKFKASVTQISTPANIFSHIKTFAEVYGSTNAEQKEWIKSRIDLANSDYPPEKIANDNITYVTLSDLDFGTPGAAWDAATRTFEAHKAFEVAGEDFDDAFFHYAKDIFVPTTIPSQTAITGTINTSPKEDRFYRIFNFDGTKYNDVTGKAYGDLWKTTGNLQIPFNSKVGDSIYIGSMWKFREMNFNLSTTADSNFNGVWEYWNGSAWSEATINDGTNALQQSGKITFTPPADWTKTEINNNKLYWLRLRTLSVGTQTPVAESQVQISAQYEWMGTSAISGEKFLRQQVDGVDSIRVPGWNPTNDKNSDGFVDDTEFASLIDPNATARFKYQSRVTSRYFSNRWVSNFGNETYRNFAADVSAAKKSTYNVEGIFIDNVAERLPDFFWGTKIYLEYPAPIDAKTKYLEDVITSLKTVKQKLGTSQIILNTGFGPWITNTNIVPIVDAVDGLLSECNIGYRYSSYDTQEHMAALWERIKFLTAANKKIILHADPNPDYWNNPALFIDMAESIKRDNIYSLAKYYLTSTDNTYFSHQDSSKYSQPWANWFKAIEYDVGSPKGDYFIYQKTADNNIYAREFSKALVLLKPMPSASSQDIGDNTATTIDLGRDYFPINSDGTLGQASSKVQIRNYEGMVLQKILKKPTLDSNNLQNIKTSDSKITFSGSAEPQSIVKITILSDPIVLSAQTDKSGNWITTLNQSLAAGEHIVYIISTLDGLDSPASDMYRFTVLSDSGTSNGINNQSVNGQTTLPFVESGNGQGGNSKQIPKTGINHFIYPALALIATIIIALL